MVDFLFIFFFFVFCFFFFQAEDGIRDWSVTGVQTCALPISAIQFRESKYIHVTGTGDSNHEYGLKIIYSKSGTSGISLSSLSSDFEIDHMDISNTGFAGIIAKTDRKSVV